MSYICHRKEPINVLILKTIFKPIKNFKELMKKLFTLVFAACASLSVSAVEKDLVTTPITIEATQGEDGLK